MAEQNFYKNEFLKYKNDPKNTWKLIKSALNKSRKTQDIILKSDDKIITNTNSICDKFNEFFNSNYTENLDPNLNLDFKSFMGPSSIDSFFLLETNHTEILNTVNKLKNSKSSGTDNISNSLLKNLVLSILNPLNHLINLSLKNGQFPNVYKTSKILPLYKSGCHHSINNYRPISLLSSISKLIEYIMHDRLTSYLNKNNTLHNSQYGFRKNSSTELAIFDLSHYISKNMESKLLTLGIFIDLSKAFDSMSHSILLSKLYHYGIRGTAYQWFLSYLSNRQHYVAIDSSYSNPLPMKGGVPQGSILGPLLFNIFLNDISNSSKLFKFILYADDTTLLARDADYNNLTKIGNEEINKVNLWFNVNNLKINFSKTNFILFGPKITTSRINFSINISNIPITRVESIKFLGVFINSGLTWYDHILHISKKISKNIGLIGKLQYKLPFEILKSLYYTLIYPYLNYCVSVWGNGAKCHLSILTKCQNYFLRILFYLKKYDHISSYYKTANMLNIYEISILKILTIFYKLFIYKISPFFHLILQNYISHHIYSMRNLSTFSLPKFRTKIYSISPLFQGMRLWNSLPTVVTNSPHLGFFKSHIYKLLSDNFFSN